MPTTKLDCSRALLGFTWLANGVLRIKATGELADDSAPVLTATLNGLFSETTEAITIFWDLSGLHRWDPGGRRDVVRTLLRHSRQIVEHHVVVTSPPLRMDMHVVAMAVGNMTCYCAPSLFDMAIEAAIGGRLRECA